MDAVKQITVNGRKYTVRMLDPITAFDFIHAVAHARANRHPIASHHRTAIAQCSDQMGRNLGDDANFTKTFSDYPEDMIPLGTLAMESLCVPFGGGSSNTGNHENN